jgi:hypothetical protein
MVAAAAVFTGSVLGVSSRLQHNDPAQTPQIIFQPGSIIVQQAPAPSK